VLIQGYEFYKVIHIRKSYHHHPLHAHTQNISIALAGWGLWDSSLTPFPLQEDIPLMINSIAVLLSFITSGDE
jgi:hypothetical protein